MSDRIGGWTAVGSGASGANAVAHKNPDVNKQHVIYGLSASFSAAPASPVLCQIVDPDVSPNTVLWEGYVSAPRDLIFPAGICLPPTHGATAVLLGSGSLTANVTIHGASR